MTRLFVIISVVALSLANMVGCGPAAPEADFSASPLGGYAPEDIQFTDLSTGNVTSWQWDFNDDGVLDSTLQNPLQTFINPGNYTVSLVVAGEGGNDTEVKTEYIVITPCPKFAEFIAEPTSMSGRNPIQFTDISTGNVTSWSWDFDSDGAIDSNEQNPQHTYTRNGMYSVTLTVSTSECTDTLTKYHHIKITGCSG